MPYGGCPSSIGAEDRLTASGDKLLTQAGDLAVAVQPFLLNAVD